MLSEEDIAEKLVTEITRFTTSIEVANIKPSALGVPSEVSCTILHNAAKLAHDDKNVRSAGWSR